MKTKRIISIILSVVLLLGCLTLANANETKKIGDINQDGKVNGMDLLLLKQHILNVPGKALQNGTDEYTAADINGDSKINGMDLLLLKKHILDAANNPMPPWPTIIVLPTEIPPTDEITTDDTTTGTTTIPTTTEPWPYVLPGEIETVGGSTISPISNNKITLMWIDHFDGPNLDSAKWSNVGRAVSLTDPYQAANISVKDSKLILTARYEADNQFTSGAVWTSGKYAVKYGRIEALLKTVTGEGNFYAFWTMGNTNIYINNQVLNWPLVGEIDIFEVLPWQGQTFGRCFLHWAELPRPGDVFNPPVSYSNYRAQQRPQRTAYGGVARIVQGDWYVFGIEWTPEKIITYCRDEKTGVETITSEIKIDNDADITKEHAFHNPHYIIINLTKDDVSRPNEVFPKTFEIDWVKVWDIDGFLSTTPGIAPRFTTDSNNKIQ